MNKYTAMLEDKKREEVYAILKLYGATNEASWWAIADEIVEKNQQALQAQDEAWIKRVRGICEEVRTECRDSDDEWDKGDECRRISDRLSEVTH